MPLFGRTFQELMTDSLEDLANSTSVTRLSSGGVARGILEAVNKRLSESYDIFDLNLARAFVSSASGQYLELIATLFGLSRESSVAATVDGNMQIQKFYVASGTFGDINNALPFTIPQGTTISTRLASSGIVYRTTEEITLQPAQNLIWVSVEASAPGQDSNVGTGALSFHSFTNYVNSSNNTLLTSNVHQIANGKNFESDANFRFRIVNKTLEAEAANRTAIRLAVLSTHGVADAILIPRYRGIGTLGVIIKSITPTVSSYLVDSVTANVQKVQAYGDLIFVKAPKETGLSMKMTVQYKVQLAEDELLRIEALIEDLVRDLVNSLDIGETFFLNLLISSLFSASDQIVNFGITGKPIDELYVHTESQLEDNKIRQSLLGDYVTKSDERVIIEPDETTPITFLRKFVGQ